jgi:hypothetical protein
MDPGTATLIAAGISTAGGIGSALFAPKPQASSPGAVYDYASLYAGQLLPGNTLLTSAAMELASSMAPYLGTVAAQTRGLGEAASQQFEVAKQKEQSLAGLQTGIASQLASSAIGLGDLAGKAKLSMEMLGPETGAALTRQYAQGVQELATEGLKGQTQLLTPAATAFATMATEAQRASNQLASNIASTNLKIKERQEDTRNALALQRGNIEGQLALKRFGAGMALAGQRSYA